ncbi:MAG: metalloregulator ArsR/SmtB family transcription factor [Candidatus Hydrogenedentes bacterium]|nr:metalloregulator ArsR/SmtB family transcription factor [Candidatus Hydrogenedentota bacterium]
MPDDNRLLAESLYEQFSRIGKALASPKRLELLYMLGQGERSVEALAKATDSPVANISQHLQVLRRARLVETRRTGARIWYRLAGPAVSNLVVSLQAVAEQRLAEVGQIARTFLNDADALEPVDREELLRRVRDGSVTVLDVRPHTEYGEGRLPRALSVPLEELTARLAEVPRNREVVAYCRGPYCVLALKAVEILRANGYRALRLDLGVVEWRSRGWQLEI